MRILVTGGAGFIGSNLIRLLLSRGHHVLNVDKLTYAGNLNTLTDVEAYENYQFLHADICDAPSLHTVFADFHPDSVIHLAAESHVDRSIDGPMEFVKTNVQGTVTLLQAATEYWREMQRSEIGDQKSEISIRPPSSDFRPLSSGFRFLHVSTDEVFGSLCDAGKFTETTPYDPHSPYSASKAASDHFVRAWMHTYGLPIIVTHCTNNYGPYQFPEKLIPVVIIKALRGDPIPVYGKGENIRDWLYVQDHAEALLTVLEKGKLGETYNIGSNNEWRNIDLVQLLCRLVDEELLNRSDFRPPTSAPRPLSESLIIFTPDRPGHDFRYALDTSKIKRGLGWLPKQDLLSGLKKTVAWYLDNEKWWQDILEHTGRDYAASQVS